MSDPQDRPEGRGDQTPQGPMGRSGRSRDRWFVRDIIKASQAVTLYFQVPWGGEGAEIDMGTQKGGDDEDSFEYQSAEWWGEQGPELGVDIELHWLVREVCQCDDCILYRNGN